MKCRHIVAIIFSVALSICLIAGVLNAIFDDTPKPPGEKRPYEKSIDTCIIQGGIPILDTKETYLLKDCQFHKLLTGAAVK